MRFLLPYWVCSFRGSKEKFRKLSEKNGACSIPPAFTLPDCKDVSAECGGTELKTRCCFPSEGMTVRDTQLQRTQRGQRGSGSGHSSLFSTNEATWTTVASLGLPSTRRTLANRGKGS